MSIKLLQYHCGRLLETLANNPQTKFHARRIGEVIQNDVHTFTRRVAERTTVWWKRTRNNLHF